VFDPDRAVGEQLAAWGKVILLETRGRVTGRPVVTAVGFVEQPDRSLLVAAGSPEAHWALNLLVHPVARATREAATREYRAEQLSGGERNSAITELILKYGTPAERLGRGPAFRLVPASSAGD
jgi:deazaflavin-dependent oxidoreductase (nitroreductase family)